MRDCRPFAHFVKDPDLCYERAGRRAEESTISGLGLVSRPRLYWPPRMDRVGLDENAKCENISLATEAPPVIYSVSCQFAFRPINAHLRNDISNPCPPADISLPHCSCERDRLRHNAANSYQCMFATDHGCAKWISGRPCGALLYRTYTSAVLRLSLRYFYVDVVRYFNQKRLLQ
ncbi:hypothetical protein EVAR_89360_1 [Eumeta japonica]|uniref:Uncharacterized protein n=1 Tax=Eumeta variegata TaxID=151549 RepID=A0A4C1Y1S3_EUMVA|nr:hypothetical protein EVAR_89360_1 [Eumeta japonica]